MTRPPPGMYYFEKFYHLIVNYKSSTIAFIVRLLVCNNNINVICLVGLSSNVRSLVGLSSNLISMVINKYTPPCI